MIPSSLTRLAIIYATDDTEKPVTNQGLKKYGSPFRTARKNSRMKQDGRVGLPRAEDSKLRRTSYAPITLAASTGLKVETVFATGGSDGHGKRVNHIPDLDHHNFYYNFLPSLTPHLKSSLLAEFVRVLPSVTLLLLEFFWPRGTVRQPPRR